MIEVIPAIIPNNYTEFEAQLSRVKDFVSKVQIDIIDGRYAPPTTWPFHPEDRESFEKVENDCLPFSDSIEFEIDMMVQNPNQYLESWMNAGASTVIIHASSTSDLGDTLDVAKGLGLGVAVALLPSDDPQLVDHFIPELSFIQLMGNDKIGYHGVELDEEKVLAHITHLKEKYPNMPLSIDIGVNEETAPRLVNAGVTKLVSGSALFGSEDIQDTIAQFENLG